MSLEHRFDQKLIFRVVVVGDGAVGKTSIIDRFLHNRFDPNHLPTIGAMYETYETSYKGRAVEIQIWDTSGGEQYKALGPIYYRGAVACFAVFALDEAVSFEHLEEWVRVVRNAAGAGCIIVVAANKVDKVEREVSTEDAAEWARARGFPYVETSAKTGEGLPALFEALVEAVGRVHIDEGILERSAGVDLRGGQGRRACC